MTTNATTQTEATAKPKMNVFIKTGSIGAVLSIVFPIILTTVVLPFMPQYAEQIFTASITLSYVTAVSAGAIAFGAFQRYLAK
jgi:hypothetical protein